MSEFCDFMEKKQNGNGPNMLQGKVILKGICGSCLFVFLYMFSITTLFRSVWHPLCFISLSSVILPFSFFLCVCVLSNLLDFLLVYLASFGSVMFRYLLRSLISCFLCVAAQYLFFLIRLSFSHQSAVFF